MDVLSFEERDSLTVLGDNVAFQMRGDTDDETMALVVYEDANRSPEQSRPFLLNKNEVDKLREVLNEAYEREQW